MRIYFRHDKARPVAHLHQLLSFSLLELILVIDSKALLEKAILESHSHALKQTCPLKINTLFINLQRNRLFFKTLPIFFPEKERNRQIISPYTSIYNLGCKYLNRATQPSPRRNANRCARRPNLPNLFSDTHTCPKLLVYSIKMCKFASHNKRC